MPDHHPRHERCYYCASDDELASAAAGGGHRTIHMDTPESYCPEGGGHDA